MYHCAVRLLTLNGPGAKDTPEILVSCKGYKYEVVRRNVVGSRPDKVNEIFKLPNPSGSTRPWDLLNL
jgi:hypothetical protein